MNYLNEQEQKELLPTFTGKMVHDAKLEYSERGEHEVSFKYYKRDDDKFSAFYQPLKCFQGGAYFTSKKEALAFIKKVNK